MAEYFDVLSQVSQKAQEYLSVLNQEQLDAVVHEGSPLLILAGAGSGKTRVVTTKIAYLIGEKNINPWQILAVTFTKKAANEMRERAIKLDERAASTHIKTFHSFGAWFLRMNAEAGHVDNNFTVYDDEDSISLLMKANPTLSKPEAKHFANLISKAKDYCLQPDDLGIEELDDKQNKKISLREVYTNYQNRLKETGNVDFGDLIMKPYLILRDNEEIRHHFHRRFKVIMVDEYQDSNVAQYLLLQELSGVNEDSGTYVCVVGDDDQSIYKFRGAEIQNILSFEQKFPNTQIIRLEKNYRSTSEILQIADDVIKNNSGRLGKKLVAVNGKGRKPVLAFLKDHTEETTECVNLIKTAVSKHNSKYSDWAILYRTNAQSLNFETAFMQNKIPYKVVGSLKFYEREEVKDLIAYLSFLTNPRDEIAFRRIVNKPPRGIGATSQDKIIENSRQSIILNAYENDESLNFLDSMIKLSDTFPKKAKEGVANFVECIEKCKELLGVKIEKEEEENSEETNAENENNLFFDFDEPKSEKSFEITEDTEKITIKVNEQIEPIKLAEKLSLLGFYRVSKVSCAGEFSLRGEVLDIFAINEDSPFRINFVFDEINSIKTFNIEDKTTISERDEITVYSMKHFEEEIEEDDAEDDAEIEKTGNLSDLIRLIIEKSGLKSHYDDEEEKRSETHKVSNMRELANSAVPFSCTFEGLIEYLDHLELDRTGEEDDSDNNKVTLITLHNTKGLEFKRVVMTGMEYGIFPRNDKVGEDIEEERRLCYVGITRARKELYLTCCSFRAIYGRTEFMDISPFLREMNPEHLLITCSKGQEKRKEMFIKGKSGQNGLSNNSFKDNSLAQKYKRGTRLYNDDYGYGEIFKAEITEKGEYKILVRFETGEVKGFLPKYSQHNLEIIND